MNTKNELIETIDQARMRGNAVKSVRNQKYDPNHFYMTCADGKQIGPVKVEGNAEESHRKFMEAQAYLASMKQPRKAA